VAALDIEKRSSYLEMILGGPATNFTENEKLLWWQDLPSIREALYSRETNCHGGPGQAGTLPIYTKIL
jgi:hypothetical protein